MYCQNPPISHRCAPFRERSAISLLEVRAAICYWRKESKKVAIFDVNIARVVKEIDLPFEKVLMAAGADKFVLAFPEQNMMQRWDLKKMANDGPSQPIPIKGQLRAIAMGNDSTGPILAFWSYNSYQKTLVVPRFSFIDPDRLVVLRVGTPKVGGTHGVGIASASGGSFAASSVLA